MTSHDADTSTSDFGSNQPYGARMLPMKIDWIVNVIIYVIMATSVIGNGVIVYVICTRKRARTAQRISIVSICVAAILVGSFVMPSYLVISTYESGADNELSTFLCKLQVYVCYWCKTVVAYSLCALVCDRYSAVREPTKRHLASGRYMFFLSFVWFFGASYNIWDVVVVTSSPRHVGATSYDGRNVTDVRRCVTSDRFGYIQNGVFYVDALLIYVIPSVAVCYMYGAIVYCRSCREGAAIRRQQDWKLLLSVGFLVTFYVCQLPLEALDACGFFFGPETLELATTKKIVEVLSFANGFLNVLIYASFDSDCRAICRRRRSSSGRKLKHHGAVLSTSGRLLSSVPRLNTNETRIDEQEDSLEMAIIVTEGAVQESNVIQCL